MNRLAAETSPYLLQHAHNPVEWYPWGAEALAQAKADDKPIFLSIGYAACHWCHVMAHESFENEQIAALMNEHFVNVKVDREERPDLDSIYMDAVVSLTGQGGWPMSVFLTPDGVPFYGGTYFPPVRRHGMPGFPDVLRGVHDAWVNRREAVLDGGREIVTHLKQTDSFFAVGADDLSSDTLKLASEALFKQFDWRAGGWGGAPKFPQPMTLEFLFRHHHRTGDALALEMATKTLDAMLRGGMYDQLGGGFHRYATDATWLVPHFEKMLYDNAQLARVYLHAWLVTRNPEYRRAAEEILDYVRREMTDPSGGFYSSQDADSEGVEGKFFVWSETEIESALGKEAALFKAAYGVTAHGNFEHHNILFIEKDAEALASQFGLPAESVRERLTAARQKLLALREQRVHPDLDDKVLSGWNGLMLAAFAEAGRYLNRADYAETATRNADFIWAHMRTPDGRLLRSWRKGEAKLNGYLEDYGGVAEGLLALYETTFDERWFAAARELADRILAHFADPAGGFFDTSHDHESLVLRPKSLQDNAVPSGNALAATVFLKLGALTGEGTYTDSAERALRQTQPFLSRHPAGFAQWLNALAFVLGEPREVAITGTPSAPDTRALLSVLWDSYRPFTATAVGLDDSAIPLLRDRPQLGGAATAYVCRHFTCLRPVTEPEAFRKALSDLA